jgi:hypothetical protein
VAEDRSRQKQVPRELRRRVALPARLRCGALWSDACILNISTRGMMIYAPLPLNGDALELRRGDHLIRARVIWRDGMRIGLQAEERVPVDEIMTLSPTCVLQLTAAANETRRRRADSRFAGDTSRLRGRAIEFVGVGILGVSLALSALAMVQSALLRPLAAASVALGPSPAN